jgi:hypothetical protein
MQAMSGEILQTRGNTVPRLCCTLFTLTGTRWRMDEDVEQMTKEQLIHEVKKLRAGIRQHRDSSG